MVLSVIDTAIAHQVETGACEQCFGTVSHCESVTAPLATATRHQLQAPASTGGAVRPQLVGCWGNVIALP